MEVWTMVCLLNSNGWSGVIKALPRHIQRVLFALVVQQEFQLCENTSETVLAGLDVVGVRTFSEEFDTSNTPVLMGSD